ncbi:MAG: hypothetical protein WCR55_10640 [Lentisphaerota bacterium]
MVGYNSKNLPDVTLVGLGLDAKDGHKRLTKGENFVVCGGSEETHGKIVETSIKVNEKLDARGKRLAELSKNEFIDIVSEASQ